MTSRFSAKYFDLWKDAAAIDLAGSANFHPFTAATWPLWLLEARTGRDPSQRTPGLTL